VATVVAIVAAASKTVAAVDISMANVAFPQLSREEGCSQ